MGLVKSVDRKEITRGIELERALKAQLNMISSRSYFPKYKVEEILYRDFAYSLYRIKNRFTVPEGLVKFTPSSASKCKRELFYKAIRAKQDEQQNYPYNNRWTRNATAVHGAVQRDLLYSPHLLENPSFTLQSIEKEQFGRLPAWEKNIEDYKVITHNGVTFVVSGMMDGILKYEKDGSTVGFEFKTKSSDNQQVHHMRKAKAEHIQQCTAYSILFGIDEFILTYECVPKDKWVAGAAAYEDIKTFYVKVTERQRTSLLNKFAEVAAMVETGELPDKQTSKCLFCPYKTICLQSTSTEVGTKDSTKPSTRGV